MHLQRLLRAGRPAFVIALAALMVLPPAGLAVELRWVTRVLERGEPAPAPCDINIPSSAKLIDGERLDGLEPGTVVCLAPGERPNLKISNVHGTPESPVIIRNDGGTTLITGQLFEAGILIGASTNLRITGTGVESHCGAHIASEDQNCGIVIDGANKGVRVLTNRGHVEGLEVDHLAILRLSSQAETRGIAVHPVLGQTIAGVLIHHNHVTSSKAEAIYIGSEPRSLPWDELGKVDRVEVAYNLIEKIGWDGIKVKVALSESRIHHNVIRDVGLARYDKHQSAITIAMSVADVHDNQVTGAPEGIKSGRAVAGSTNQFHANVIADVGVFGIQAEDDGARIYNNTIVRSEGIGIRARGKNSHIFENLVADAAEPIVTKRDAVLTANLVGTALELGIADASNGDYSLRSDSPAVGSGRILRLELCARAGIRAPRPITFSTRTSLRGNIPVQGCRSNVGALSVRPG